MLDSKARAAALDAKVGLKGWNIPFFSYGNTLLQDAGGFRTTLANYGIGILVEDIALSAVNTLPTPTKDPKGNQTYWGQRPSVVSTMNLYMTYDLGKVGIDNGQLQFAGSIFNSTMDSYIPSTSSIYRLAYYQSLFDKKIEFGVGYMSNGLTFVGTYVGGQLQNPFGPSSSIPVELGLSASASAQPTAWVKYNFTDNFYNQFGVARSTSPTSNAILSDIQVNPTQLDFNVPGADALYINELGYKEKAAPGTPETWLRAGGVYNTSLYKNYAIPGTKSTNNGFYVLGDRQLWQAAPSSSATAYRGLYAGASAMYAQPETNIITQYYEGRLYAKGPFDSRPNDLIVLVYGHNTISKYFANPVNLTALTTGTYANFATNTITATYTAKLTDGLYATVGMGYSDNPSVTYFQREGHALNFLASTFVAF